MYQGFNYHNYVNVFSFFQTLEAIDKNLVTVRTFKRHTP